MRKDVKRWSKRHFVRTRSERYMNKISISDLLSQLFNERIIRFNVPQNFITEKISSTLFLDLWTRIKLSGIKNERKSWFEKESSETISSISSPWSKRSRRTPPIERWKRSSHTEELIEESRTKFFRISLTTRTSRRGNKRNEP